MILQDSMNQTYQSYTEIRGNQGDSLHQSGKSFPNQGSCHICVHKSFNFQGVSCRIKEMLAAPHEPMKFNLCMLPNSSIHTLSSSCGIEWISAVITWWLATLFVSCCVWSSRAGFWVWSSPKGFLVWSGLTGCWVWWCFGGGGTIGDDEMV